MKRRTGLVDRVYQEIKGQIVAGAYAPGAPLSEPALAALHRASRTPVREALSRLLQEGYVQRVAGRGYSVTPITLKLVRDTFHVRRLLEGEAASRAARLADGAEVARLRRLARFKYAQGTDPQSAHAANAAFHLALAAASRNALLLELVGHCLSQTQRFMSLGMELRRFSERAAREHEAVVSAIARGDAAASRRAIERHLDGSSRWVLAGLLQGGIRGMAV